MLALIVMDKQVHHIAARLPAEYTVDGELVRGLRGLPLAFDQALAVLLLVIETSRSGSQHFLCRSCTCSFAPSARKVPTLKEQAGVLKAQGKNRCAIACTLSVDHQTVRRWLQAFQARSVVGASEKVASA
jgi:hypothetical protein